MTTSLILSDKTEGRGVNRRGLLKGMAALAAMAATTKRPLRARCYAIGETGAPT